MSIDFFFLVWKKEDHKLWWVQYKVKIKVNFKNVGRYGHIILTRKRNTEYMGQNTCGSLKQHKFILSQLWRLNVWDQGVHKATLTLKPLVWNPSLPLWASVDTRHSLARDHITVICVSVLTWPSLPFPSVSSLLSFIRALIIGFRARTRSRMILSHDP